MFGTVIVPLDGSSHAEIAVPYAVDEARRHGAALVLVRVIPRPEPGPGVRGSGPAPRQPDWPPHEIAAAEQQARRYLRDVIKRHGLRPETATRVVVGDPRLRLAAEVAHHPSPLLVMTTGDATGGARPPLSTVAGSLMVGGVVPVLGVRQPPTGPVAA